MKIDYLLFVDTYSKKEGKINLDGIYETLSAAEFPYTRAAMGVAYRIRHTSAEANMSYQFRLKMINEDATYTVFDEEFPLPIGPMKPGKTWAIMNAAKPFFDVTFPTPGEYSLSLFINDIEFDYVVLTVVQEP